MVALLAAAAVPLDPLSGLSVSSAHADSNILRIADSGAGVSRRVKLGLNKAVVVDLPTAAGDILVADPSIADAVTRTSSRLYLFGKSVGQTNIFVFGPNGEEIVTLDLAIERDITGLEQQLTRFIPDSDISVEIINDNIVLNGTVQTPQDSQRASQLAQIFLTGGEATTRNLTAVGEGGDAAIFAEDRQVSQIVNLLNIEGEDQVTLKVTVAEVSRQVLKQLGFNTFASVSGSRLGGSFASQLPANLGKPAFETSGGNLIGSFGDFDINSYMNAMERAGVMRTLAEPSLTAISGEAASFYVGGDFRLVDGQDVSEDDNGQRTLTYDIAQVQYGIGLDFTPVVLSPGRISLRVRTEVSEPTFEDSVSLSAGMGVQGANLMSIRRREAETSVELPSGGSIVIAGLVKDDIRQAMSGHPGISKIPVLGTLFRSRDFQRNETELVIIATPYLVRPTARNELARPDDNFNAASDGAGFFLGKVNRVYGRMETELPKGRYHGVVGFIYK
ncbi:type II and III secretion system protein family protein [Pararhizobium haloflavum]|uniref:type II and III secretion system protein family protein n=1 Tax=Pararhizobium haloflavum TaxID=2037914 RepID=UPI000C1A4A9C|nr:type II and III secretion system protein family protein [Pararhizobium haloflavum]